MSSTEVNALTPNKKVMSGCGDGVANGHHQERSLKGAARHPVPSSRRFCTRPPPSQKNGNANVKVQLQKAIQELATHPNITRRKALTIAEITPSRSHHNKTDGLQLSTPGVRGTKALAAATPDRDEDAGRRVYQLLLLHAWRQRRAQVATLADSLGALETQNGQLELQVDALKRLRKSECEKRAEAVAEAQGLHTKVDKTLQENEILKEEKSALGKEIKILEDKVHDLQLDLQNAQNDWMTVRCELRNTEQQLAMERSKIKKLREEQNGYLEQLTRKEEDIAELHEQTDDLQERLLNTELHLQGSLVSQEESESDRKKLLLSLQQETSIKNELQMQLEEIIHIKDNLETKVQELRKSIKSSRESRKKLEEENCALKKGLAAIRDALMKEQQLPWWKNAGKLALASLNTLKMMAHIMLPAMPHIAAQTLPADCIQHRDC